MPPRHSQPRKSYHHGDLRQALLDAALDIVRRRGVAALTLRAVASQARVSHMAPYHHFADKAALIAAVAEEGFRGLQREMLERIARHPDDPRAQFRESGVAYVVFAVKNPNLFRVMFGPQVREVESHPGLQEAAEAAFAVVQGLVERSQEVRAVRDEDSRAVGISAWALVHGIAMLCVDGQLGQDSQNVEEAERLAYAATGTLFRGLRR